MKVNTKIDVTIKKRNCFLEVPWGFQNPLKIDPGTTLRDPKACKGTPERPWHTLVASWVHAGIIPGELWELLGGHQGRSRSPRNAKMVARDCPGACWGRQTSPKLMPNSVRELRRLGCFAQLLQKSFSQQCFNNFCSFLAFL